MSKERNGLVKVNFPLIQDEDGFPPVSSESMWAKDLGKEMYRIESIPFFVTSLAFGDVVYATLVDGRLNYSRHVFSSGRGTIHLVFFDVEDNEIKKVRDDIKTLGCDSEYMDSMALIAIDIPDGNAFRKLRKYLSVGEEAGRWEYQESCLCL